MVSLQGKIDYREISSLLVMYIPQSTDSRHGAKLSIESKILLKCLSIFAIQLRSRCYYDGETQPGCPACHLDWRRMTRWRLITEMRWWCLSVCGVSPRVGSGEGVP